MGVPGGRRRPAKIDSGALVNLPPAAAGLEQSNLHPTPSLLDAEQGAELFLPYLEVTGCVLLGYEREAGVDPWVDRLAVSCLCGLLDTDLPHRVRVLRHGGIHVAPDDRLGGLDRPVDPNEDRVALVSLQGLYGAEGHLVVGREDGIQFRVGLQEVLHRTHCLEPVEVRGDLTDYLDVGVLNGLPHSGLPLVAGNRAGDARYEADASFAVHLPL